LSLKYCGILLKAAGLAFFLVPLFMKGLGYVSVLPHAGIITLMAIGVALLIVGNVCEAKILRAKKNRGTQRGK
jgi:hypothetical protein